MSAADAARPFLEVRHVELAAAIDAFAVDAIESLAAPTNDAAARRQAREILRRLGGGGWLRHLVPPGDGGADHAPETRTACLVRERLAAASPLADAVFALQALGTLPLVLAGDGDQRRRWLPDIAAGRVMTAFAMTEPGAGTDVSAISSTARRDGDDYVVDGEKTLISNAGIADLYTVFASTDPEAGRSAIVALLVPAGTEGLSWEAQVLSAPHPIGRLRFDACRVPVGARLGSEDGGYRLGMATLDRLRPTVAAAACGMASRALELALEHAREREQFGRPLADFQLVQEKLARMATELTAARLLTYRAAMIADREAWLAGHRVAKPRGRRTASDDIEQASPLKRPSSVAAVTERALTAAAAMAKAHATEAAQRIVDEAVQIVGGHGCLADHPVDRLYRSVRALRIYEGTTEIQRLILARELLRE